MENEPNTDNVSYIDEYPHLEEKLRLQRMGQLVLFPGDMNQLILFPVDGDGGDEGA